MHDSPKRGHLLMPSGLPMPIPALARILGLAIPALTKTLGRIAAAGVSSQDDAGAVINRRMVRDQKIREARTEAGRLGGNPDLLNQKLNPKLNPEDNDGVNRNPTPSYSSSSSTSSSGEKQIYGQFSNVLLTDNELTLLCTEFGRDGAKFRIENLSNYVASKNKKYSSHYATLLVWEKNKTNGGNGNGNGHGLQHRESNEQAKVRRNFEAARAATNYMHGHPGDGIGGGDHNGTDGALPASPFGPKRLAD